jgi:hypothetical protein
VSGYIDDELRLEYSEDGTWSTVYTLKTYTAADPPPTSLSLVSYAPTSGTLNSSTKLTNAQLRLRLSVVNGGAGDGFTVYLGAARIASKTVVETLYATAYTKTTGISVTSGANMTDAEFDGDWADVDSTAWTGGENVTFTTIGDPVTATRGEYLEIRVKGSWTDPNATGYEYLDVFVSPDGGTNWTNVGNLLNTDVTTDFVVKRYPVDSVLTTSTQLTNAQVKLQGVTGADDTINLDIDGVRIVTGTKVYTVTYDGNNYRDTSYAPPKISEWCSQCHTKYLVASGQEEARATNTNFQYRHMTQGLSGGCLKCHVAHGTIAAMGTYSNQVTYPDANAAEATTRSRLLHVDNRGVCMQCHSAITSD